MTRAQFTYNGPMEEPLDEIPREDEVTFKAGSGATAHLCQFYAFNTDINFMAFGPKDLVTQSFEQGVSACRTYERLFSRTLPHSDISRLNAAQGKPVAINRATYELLEYAQEYCQASQGVFDISIGSVSRLWDFHQGKQPSQHELDVALPHVNWRNLKLFEEDGVCYAQLANPLTMIDAGGIAKGYIADKLEQLFLDGGMQSFLINLGGNIVTHGEKPNNKPWMVGVQDPFDSAGTRWALKFPLANASIVTSGINQRGFEDQGVWYHHILDPATGMPAKTDTVSVSVVCRWSIDAEGFSTTLLALGVEKGLAFAQTEPRIDKAVFIDRKGQVHQTEKGVL